MRWGSLSLLFALAASLHGCASTRVSAAQLALSPASQLAPELAALSLRLALGPRPLPCPPRQQPQPFSLPLHGCQRSPFVRVYVTIEYSAPAPPTIEMLLVCRTPEGAVSKPFSAEAGRARRTTIVVGTWKPVGYRVSCRMQQPEPRPLWGGSPHSKQVGSWVAIDVPAHVIAPP